MNNLKNILATHVTEPTNLFGLLSKYRVIVPGIQRHYVQGGADPHAKEVRQRFIGDILQSAAENKSLSLDYIYGPIDTTGMDAFTPVDGQQRLTTIWLVARYFAEKLPDPTRESVLALLARFSYEDRIHATRFCRALTDPKNKLGLDLSSNKVLSAAVEREAWFNPYWSKDSTVAAMLNMLNTISKLHQKSEFNALRPEEVLLHVGTKLTFKLCVDSFGQDIYMKMNARGLSLTQWENFKGRFADLLDAKNDKKGSDGEDSDKKKWNTEVERYANSFFTLAGKRLPDDPFLSLIARIFVYENDVLKAKSKNETDGNKTTEALDNDNAVDALKRVAEHNDWSKELPYAPFSEFELLVEKLRAASLLKKSVTTFLRMLCYILKEAGDTVHEVPYWQTERKLLDVVFLPKNQNERDFSLMLYEYFKKHENANRDLFARSIRFMWNILENVSRDSKSHLNRVHGVTAFFDKQDAYEKLRDPNCGSTATVLQYKEERAKAELYRSNENIELLNEVEKLMHGRVRLALLELKSTEKDCEIALGKYEERLEKLKLLLETYQNASKKNGEKQDEEKCKLLIMLVVASAPLNPEDAVELRCNNERIRELLTTRDDWFLQESLVDKISEIDLEGLNECEIEKHLESNRDKLSSGENAWMRDWRKSLVELAQRNDALLWNRAVRLHYNYGLYYLYRPGRGNVTGALPINDWRFDLLSCEKYKEFNDDPTNISINDGPTRSIGFNTGTEQEYRLYFWKDYIEILPRGSSRGSVPPIYNKDMKASEMLAELEKVLKELNLKN